MDKPVAWRTFDGEGGYDYRSFEGNENYADEWDKRNPNHKGWVEPLYTHPQPKREWIGLTEQDRKNIHAMWIETDELTDEQDVIDLVEKLLKEKNNG